MKIAIKISESVINRISKLTNSCSGNLFGISSKGCLTIVALQTDENIVDLVDFLPVGVENCGIFKYGDDTPPQNICGPVLLTYKDDKIDAFIEKNGKYTTNTYSLITEQEINNTFLYIRLKGEIPLTSELTTSSIKEAFQSFHKIASSELVFSYFKSNMFLLSNESIGIDSNMSLNEFCEESNSFSDEINLKKKAVNVKPRILEFKVLRQLTKGKSNGDVKEHAPVAILDKSPFKAISTNIPIDCISMVHSETKIEKIYDNLLESIKRLFKLFESRIINFAENKNSSKNPTYQVLHFYPEECCHFLTVLYPKDQEDKDLQSDRLNLHTLLLLDTSTPSFRRANQYNFDHRKANGPLINPHIGLKATGNGGTLALVKGKYEYYHYCQNKMDDNGWGCAYRSLQTLASWFKLQGFVDREVPTFTEIQQCLVDIKDKPSSFVGSRQWIGSTEVNFVLNTLLGIENKILYVSSGEEMGSKGPELLNHFQNHGSPIMIGGGVLAHTILGVDYNQQTGTIKFLILDPHYTGSEDLQIIQNKGWCGWKNVDFWDKSSYYNMCLPLVPREV